MASTEAAKAASRAHYRRNLVEEEIAKCDVLCANCHSIYHYSRGKDF